MNLRRAYAGFAPSELVLADARLRDALERRARRHADGPWLFGDYSVADAFFAPVAARVATYDLPVRTRRRRLRRRPPRRPRGFLEWREIGLADPVLLPQYEFDLLERPWPGP